MDSSQAMEDKYIPASLDCEDLEDYEPDGYHPVLIGAGFCNGRYEIVHKLGSGGTATVWLAWDREASQHVAIKILTARASKLHNEVRIHETLQKHDFTTQKLLHVAPLLAHFEIEGPNGKHECLTFPFLGPSVRQLLSLRSLRSIDPRVIRQLALQTLHAVQGLHQRGIVIGDLSTSNMLLHLSGADKWSTREIYDRFGAPKACEVELMKPVDFVEEEESRADQVLRAQAPQYWYNPLRFSAIDATLVQQSIALIDLGEALQKLDSVTDETMGLTFGYAAPELILEDTRSDQSDIWALACCWFEMRSGKRLFEEGMGGRSDVLDAIQLALGPFPPAWAKRVLELLEEEGVEFIEADSADPENVAATTESTEDHSLRARVRNVFRWSDWTSWTADERLERLVEDRSKGDKETADYLREALKAEIQQQAPPPGPGSKAEGEDFGDLLSKMLRYDPAERITLDELLRHPWFSTAYEDGWDPDVPWLEFHHQ